MSKIFIIDTKKNLKKISWMLFILYLSYLSYLLFFSPEYGRTGTSFRYNLIPFYTIKNFIIYRNYVSFKDLMINLLGNIIAFIPMGFFISILFNKKRGLIKILFISMFISSTIEVLQYKFNVGNFDIDDIILNTFGGILGYIVFKIIYFIFKAEVSYE